MSTCFESFIGTAAAPERTLDDTVRVSIRRHSHRPPHIILNLGQDEILPTFPPVAIYDNILVRLKLEILSAGDLADKLRGLIERYQEGELRPEDYEDFEAEDE